MGIFRTSIVISPVDDSSHRRELHDVMVDTGSEYNWIPGEVLIDLGIAPTRIDRFKAADGRVFEREVGFAFIEAAGRSTPTVVVFARPGDETLLGAIGLEGMNLRVDLVSRELISAGPVPW